MKCPKCGGRKFSVIKRALANITYDDEDKAITSDIREWLFDEPGSHFCLACDIELDDEGKEIIR